MDKYGQGEETQILHRVPHDNKDPQGAQGDDEHGLWVGPDPGLMNSMEV